MGNFVNHINSNKTRPHYKKVLQDIQKDDVCPFCMEHLTTYHKNPVLFETEFWVATDNMYPYAHAKHHMLFIHKQHIESVTELSPEAWANLQDVVKAALKMKDMDGGAILFRFGSTEVTGASVSHLHANLVAGPGGKDSEPVLARVG